jgi:hypothetical protein
MITLGREEGFAIRTSRKPSDRPSSGRQES